MLLFNEKCIYKEDNGATMSRPFCVKCGKEAPLYEHLCSSCFLERHTLATLPHVINLVFCVHCGALEHRGKWIDYDNLENAVRHAVEEHLHLYPNTEILHLTTALSQESIDEYQGRAQILLNYHGLEVSKDLHFKVRLKKSTCPRCSRYHGNYYEAIIQVRALHRPLTKHELAEIKRLVHERLSQMKESGRDVFLSKEEEKHSGIDFYISSSSVGKMLAEELASRYAAAHTTSPKLVGRREGRDVYRMTYLVRLPRITVGDVIKVEGRVVMVQSISKGKVEVVELQTGETKHHPLKAVADSKVLAKLSDAEEAVVNYITEREVQVLDPETYRSVTLIKPKGMGIGETVKVLRVEGNLYIVR